MSLFFEIHKNIPKEGPGSVESTQRAIAALGPLPKNPQIYDIGCGPGEQTMVLASNFDGEIVAVDTHQPFLDRLSKQLKEQKPLGRVQVLNRSMDALEVPANSIDLIWSEGALYIMGFKKGLEACYDLLKPGGMMAVTELLWLKDNPPKTIADYWKNEYPEMLSLMQNTKLVESVGFELLDQFVLPESDWWHYYHPLEERINQLRKQYQNDPEGIEEINENAEEIDLYRQFSEWYGYSFFVLKKPLQS